jgi:hypothetical protein
MQTLVDGRENSGGAGMIGSHAYPDRATIA